MLGRFMPDFGRIVAQMQYDMYHVYTVDEHTLRAIGILHQIENGAAEGRAAARHRGHAASSLSRRALYVATLPARHRQGPRRRPHRARRADRAKRCARAWACRTRRPRPSPGWCAGTSSMSRHRLQARHRRPADHPRLRRHRAVARAAEAAAGADRRRHPRGRAQGLERLEGPAAARALPRGGGRDGGGDPRGRRARRIERAKRKPARRSPKLPAEPGRGPRSRPTSPAHDPRYWLGFDPRACSPCPARARRRRRAGAARGRLPHRRVPRA